MYISGARCLAQLGGWHVSSIHTASPLFLQGWALLRARTGDFATAALISFLVNLFCYLAIKHVSATSFKVAGAHACSPWGACPGQAELASVLQQVIDHTRRSSSLPLFFISAHQQLDALPRRLPEECAGSVGRHPAG